MAEKHTQLPVTSGYIFTGIPIPPKRRRCKYPFGSLEIGQSLFSLHNMTNSANLFGERNDKSFTVRPYTHEGQEGYMCWRVS